MNDNVFPFGTQVCISVSFEDAAGEPVDPDTVTCQLRGPDDVPHTYSMVQDTELVDGDPQPIPGSYHYDYTPQASGPWRYRCAGTGSNAAAAEHFFYVKASAF